MNQRDRRPPEHPRDHVAPEPHTITVYEARTGAELGRAHVEARDTCPLSASVYRQDPVVYATPSPQQYFDALQAFVNRR